MRRRLPVASVRTDIVHLDRKSIHKTFVNHAKEHFPASTVGVFPVNGNDEIAILLVANKYSPNNFW